MGKFLLPLCISNLSFNNEHHKKHHNHTAAVPLPNHSVEPAVIIKAGKKLELAAAIVKRLLQECHTSHYFVVVVVVPSSSVRTVRRFPKLGYNGLAIRGIFTFEMNCYSS
jgi:hypothetical protein